MLKIFLLNFAFCYGPILAEERQCNRNATACKRGVILPPWLGGSGADELAGKALVYLLSLLYMFLGVSIIADKFMAAIEVITSKERELVISGPGGQTHTLRIRVWNDTVANLTLMALGSSAPEILLSLIETIGLGFKSGDLGPGTIVGSAAFNMFLIIGICVFVVPSNEVRRVKEIQVFWVVVCWSLFAYLWLFLIICTITPGRVDWWEGTLTFAFFPLTVISAYAVDRKFPQLIWLRLRQKRGGKTSAVYPTSIEGSLESFVEDSAVKDFEKHRIQYISIFKDLRKRNPDTDIQTLMRLAENEMIRQGPKSRAFYRVQATRQLLGEGDVIDKYNKSRASKMPTLFKKRKPKKKTQIEVFFEPAHYTCLENVGTVYLTVVCDRSGVHTPCNVFVDYATAEGSAKEGSDYESQKGTLTFRRTADEKEVNVIGINIVDNDLFEEDEHFFVNLHNMRAESTTKRKDMHIPVTLRAPYSATVMIVDNDHAGSFEFKHDKEEVIEDSGTVSLEVIRTRGSRGEVKIPYKCRDGGALADRDYRKVEGELVFGNEETTKSIVIPIINTDQYEKMEDFNVELSEPIWTPPASTQAEGQVTSTDLKEAEMGKAQLGTNNVCTIVIRENSELKGYVDRVATTTNTNSIIGSSTWSQQFKDALMMEVYEDEEPGCSSKFLHYLVMPWKLLFAFVPPSEYFGGWPCFVISIAVIGMITALIGDLASHFGCTVGLKDSVTAITLVAIGTSLPDTFASKVAAINDEHADSSIGNVTGSNAVNVYLGIGLAWMVAAIYNNVQNKPFTVEPGELGLSVTVFLVGAVIGIVILQIRRYSPTVGAELGGNYKWKVVTVILFFLLWLTYIVICSLVAYCYIKGF